MVHDAGAHLHTVGSVAEACAPWTRVSTPSSRMAGRHVGTSVARSALLPWYPCSTPQPRYRSPLQAVSPTLAGARTGSWRLGGIALDVVSRVERSEREDQARGGICVTVGEGEVGGGKLLGPERVPDLDHPPGRGRRMPTSRRRAGARPRRVRAPWPAPGRRSARRETPAPGPAGLPRRGSRACQCVAPTMMEAPSGPFLKSSDGWLS